MCNYGGVRITRVITPNFSYNNTYTLCKLPSLHTAVEESSVRSGSITAAHLENQINALMERLQANASGAPGAPAVVNAQPSVTTKNDTLHVVTGHDGQTHFSKVPAHFRISCDLSMWQAFTVFFLGSMCTFENEILEIPPYSRLKGTDFAFLGPVAAKKEQKKLSAVKKVAEWVKVQLEIADVSQISADEIQEKCAAISLPRLNPKNKTRVHTVQVSRAAIIIQQAQKRSQATQAETENLDLLGVVADL